MYVYIYIYSIYIHIHIYIYINLICTMGMPSGPASQRLLVPSISELAPGKTGPAVRQVAVALPGIAGFDTTHSCGKQPEYANVIGNKW